MKVDYINVVQSIIFGINRSTVLLVGNITKKNVSFKAYADGKEIICLSNINDKCFMIETKINKDVKEIKISALYNGKEDFIFVCKNNLLMRIKGTVKNLFNKYRKNSTVLYCKYLMIKDLKLNGLLHPAITVNGLITNDNVEFFVNIDGKKNDFELVRYNEQFKITSSFSKNNKMIDIYVKDCKKNQIDHIVHIRNSFFVRLRGCLSNILHSVFGFAKRFVLKFYYFFKLIFKAIKFCWCNYHFIIPPVIFKKYFKLFLHKLKNLGNDCLYYNPFNISHYNKWLASQKKTEYKELKYKPLISIVIPVYNIKENLLSDCLDSVLCQSYQNFEVCLADDCSTLPETKKILEKYIKKDSRIKVKYREKNGHISESTNTAISMASGDFISFMDDDDILTKDALYYVVEALNNNKNLDLIYTDEDKMELNGKLSEPYFKPDWSPDTLLSFNYITHFTTVRKSIIEKVGGLRSEYNGAQDFDLMLRVTEVTKNIYHIPHICYHWRKVEGSTALKMSSKNYALYAGKAAIEDALKRRKIDGEVSIPAPLAHYIVEYKIKKEPLVSILIPIRDQAEVTKKCIDSIYKLTTYKNFEIILINNDSQEEKTFNLLKNYQKKYSNFKVVDAIMEFNYSKINNLGAKNANGEYLLLLNNDTEVITPKWLDYMVGYAMQDHIGAVGAKLYYPDDTIQHCGVVLGIAGCASHFAVGTPRGDNGPFARYMVPYDNGAVTAACLMVSKKKYEEVGGLDENMKVAFNDVEFNIRLLKKGYYNVCLPQVELHHFESKSRGMDTTGEKYKRFLKEKAYLQEKGGEYIKRDPFYNPNLSKSYPMMLPIEEYEYPEID